ncbi:MAG: aminotransferase class V-fold PLP-dependent enzyme [Acidobacteria bacterium]|nr:aminotransferase class V-fold PLP-dependent enzyme [Acidobacteriota bacterium]
MITFNPGPAQIDNQTQQALADLAYSGFLSQSHRGSAFVARCREAVEGLRRGLLVPEDYQILLQPSATAAMDTLLRNLVRKRSSHFVHGAFSERFWKTSAELGLEADALRFAADQAIDPMAVPIHHESELIAITHNETATGLMWPFEVINALRSAQSEPMLAVDITSSLGCMAMPWQLADVWFGSVQKGLGLPAGLGLLFVSPRAFARCQTVLAHNRVAAWQRLDVMAEKMAQYQTLETPNMVALALLAERMSRFDQAAIERETRVKARQLYDRLGSQAFVQDPEWRSLSTAHFWVNNAEGLQKQALERGLILGSGYGTYKGKSIRIANFPALDLDAIRLAIECVLSWSS